MNKVNKQNNRRKGLKTAILSLLLIFVFNCCIFLCLAFFVKECDSSSDSEGWYCHHLHLETNSFVIKILKNHYSDKCTEDLGLLDSKLSGMYGYVFDCRIPYSDSGNSCKNSDECKGNCEYKGFIPDSCIEKEKNLYVCPDGITGRCSKFKETNFYDEVVNGELHRHRKIVIY
ncbi:hypothetical protein KBG23_03195 [Candidatus Dojkabacteria bacterium]|jgi:hypothetical protein|nr:hypothetical protein [Candidatus Dojkabacteria bacterium]